MEPERYDVVLLIEQPLTAADATQVRTLHADFDAQVVYHLLLPMTDAAAAVEASLGSMGGSELLAPEMELSPQQLADMHQEHLDQAERDLAATSQALTEAGAEIGSAKVVTEPPVDALQAKVSEVDGREAIILTRPHVVAEFFHVDWTSRARRKLGVPVLHLLEHENFDEQAGGGEGISGV